MAYQVLPDWLSFVFDLISYSALATVASLLSLEPTKHTPISDPGHLIFPLPGKFFLQDKCVTFFLTSFSVGSNVTQ